MYKYLIYDKYIVIFQNVLHVKIKQFNEYKLISGRSFINLTHIIRTSNLTN